ncbi:MAG: ABC transporter permease [Deltaproteobacteria bacterium]|nr:ABC transporter permease [Deltaproteobacteria bacterium]
MSDKRSNFKWHCRRMGGTDQVTLTTMEELRHLRELDPKLWGALSCPATGIEFDQRTIALLDADGDGRIRMPEVLDAVEWLCARINDTANITGEPAYVPLSVIDTTNEQGQRLLTTANTVLGHLGRKEATCISPEDVKTAIKGAAEQTLNGDGILPPLPGLDDDVRAFIKAGLDIVGGTRDASGEAGLSTALAEALVQELQTWQGWQEQVNAAPHPVENTAEAWTLLEEIRDKVDDYFLRCSLAAFAPQAEAPLNADERLLAATDKPDIDKDIITTLPLARIATNADLPLGGGPNSIWRDRVLCNLPLGSGLNPIWRDRVLRFVELMKPLLSSTESLSPADWKTVQEALAPYGEALAARPEVGVYEEGAFAPPENPAAAIDALGADAIHHLLADGAQSRFNELCAKDLSSASAAEDIAELEKLVLYYCHLHRLLMNFVSFHDFYSLRKDVTFRAGTLYIDGRSCQLCVPVEDRASHSKMASMSQLCLLYCDCTRRGEGDGPGKRSIMAALTAGNDDVLVEGRNGVFVDNTGQDWDATLTQIVHNPIDFRQAVWSPYKRLSQMVKDQIAKIAANKDAALAAAKAPAGTAAAPKPAGQPFDMGKSVGIFAAVGIALGAIGTAVGSITQALFSLSWWQFPLLFLGLFSAVSGPSLFSAWRKCSNRTLGPILEASGWAVNTQLPITSKLGNALTDIAEPPRNIERQSILDPFSEVKKRHGGRWFLLLVLLAALAAGGWLWKSGQWETVKTKTVEIFQTLTAKPAEKATDAKKKDAAAKADAKPEAAPEDVKKADDSAAEKAAAPSQKGKAQKR